MRLGANEGDDSVHRGRRGGGRGCNPLEDVLIGLLEQALQRLELTIVEPVQGTADESFEQGRRAPSCRDGTASAPVRALLVESRTDSASAHAGAGAEFERNLLPIRRARALGGAAKDRRTIGYVIHAVQEPRATIFLLIPAIAFAGFNPFGQAVVQFMMVWQRYRRNGSSRSSSRSPAASSRLSTSHR